MTGVLGDQRDDGRQDQEREVQREARRGEVGQPDPRRVADRSDVHQAVVLGRLGRPTEHRGDRAGGDVEQPGEQVAEDQAQEDGDAGPEAAQQQGGDDDEGHRGQRHPLVLRPVDAGHDRSQVEADQQHHGTGDRGRQDAVQEPDPGDVDEHTHQGQDDAGHQDRADDVAVVTAGRADGDHASDEGRAGAQVARHLPAHHEQEDDRRDAAHHDREVRVQAHDQGEDEGRPEHGDDVLRADAHGERPGEPLVGGHRLAQRRGLAVPVELPAERHDRLLDPRLGRGRFPRTDVPGSQRAPM